MPHRHLTRDEHIALIEQLVAAAGRHDSAETGNLLAKGIACDREAAVCLHSLAMFAGWQARHRAGVHAATARVHLVLRPGLDESHPATVGGRLLAAAATGDLDMVVAHVETIVASQSAAGVLVWLLSVIPDLADQTATGGAS